MVARVLFGARLVIPTFLFTACLASSSQGAEKNGSSEDAEIRARIEARLADLPDREGAEIRVAVREGAVLLQGKVRLLEQSLRAEQTTWKTPGVLDVDNELRVLALAPGGDDAIERQVRLIIKAGGAFLDTSLAVEVAAGVVRLRGVFQDPGDVLALKHRIASIPGVLEVEIDALMVASREEPRALGSSRFPIDPGATFYL